MKSKTVVVVSDLHVGHIAGLTPPEHFSDKLATPGLHALQSEMYLRYLGFTKKYKHADLVICNGDAIDGKGSKSGGCELWSSDRKIQADTAADLLEMFDAKKYILTYGTSFHSGIEEDWEAITADRLDADIHSHAQIEINGVIFDIKHHSGNSAVPHGRHTAAAKEHLWNILWSDEEACKRADIIIRSHVHYHAYAGGADWLAITTPALQAPSHNKYGGRRCSGVVDWGILVFNIDEKGAYTWQAQCSRLESAKAELIKV